MSIDLGRSLVAHRGFSSAYPENTLLSVEAALKLGACYVEVDVHLSADKVPVVIHDASLLRTAGKSVNVMDQQYEQLKKYSVHQPDRFGDQYRPQTIARLQDVVELMVRYPNRTLFIETKRASIKRFGVEAFLQAIRPVVEPYCSQCVLISFDHEMLVGAKQMLSCPLGWVFENWGEDSFRIMEQLKPEYLFTDYSVAPDSLAPGPWRWAVYTIDDADLALQWFQKGADLVETNSFGTLIDHPFFHKCC